MFVAVLRIVNLAYLELIGELIQDIHKFGTGISLK